MAKPNLTLFQKGIFLTSLIALCIFFYYGVYLQRKAYIQKYYRFSRREPFSTSGYGSSGMRSDIMNATESENIKSKELSDVHIKASANSALYTDNEIIIGEEANPKGLYGVMLRGCRFLDFEIYNIDGKGMIGYSSSSSYSSLETNTVPVLDALYKILDCAFTNTVPNPDDPLILQFRMKTTKAEIYRTLVQDLIDVFGDILMVPVSDTTIEGMARRIIPIVVTNDKNKDSPYKDVKSIDTKRTFEKSETDGGVLLNEKVLHVHLDSGYNSYKNDYNVSLTDTDNTVLMQVLMPSIDNLLTSSNLEVDVYKDLADVSGGINIIPYKFYVADEQLNEYENIFEGDYAIQAQPN